jgi:hypothetical protein
MFEIAVGVETDMQPRLAIELFADEQLPVANDRDHHQTVPESDSV